MTTSAAASICALPKPRVVTAGVPSLKPEVTIGGERVVRDGVLVDREARDEGALFDFGARDVGAL